MVDTEQGEVFSERLTDKGRTYFFDVKVSPNGHTYLSISETHKSGEKRERSRLIIDKSRLREFKEVLDKVSHVIDNRLK